jgi:glycosyltransferase involved in cell wall biosynthesis
MKRITVFTPTFNRAYCLYQLYDSLCNQTSKNFEWLVVDDGSTDNTKELIEQWIQEKKISIRYIFQENKGMVAAHNTAHYNIHTELNVCIDSDDFMPNDGIERISNHWDGIKDKSFIMGLVGLDVYKNGKVIGNIFPENVIKATFSEIINRYKIKGDKKYVLRTDLIKSVLPYPYIKGERFPAPSYLYLLLEKKYKFSLMNEPICVVEYLPDGNSMNKMKQYKNSPNAFALYRIAKIKYAYNFKDKFKNCVHYISSKLLGDRKNIIKDSPEKLLTVLAFPFGLVLYFYILNKSGAANKHLNRK